MARRDIARAREMLPDLILSDVMMPTRSGDQMVRDLRAHREIDDVPIVMLTAKADDDLRIRMLREGAQDYVMKPFLTEEVQARVGKPCEHSSESGRPCGARLPAKTENIELMARELIDRKHELETANEQLRRAVLEAHHRIKNNLQAVTALVELELDEGDDRLPRQILEESLRRIKAIALVHDSALARMFLSER